MEAYIKYQRFTRDINGDDKIQKFFDELIGGGWNIIYYDEKIKDVFTLTITIVAGKKQNNVL